MIKTGNKNITLEIMSPEDKSELYSLVCKNRANLRIFMDWVDDTNREDDLDDYLNSTRDMFENGEGCNYKIIEDNSIMGAIGFFKNNPIENVFEIGYWIDFEKRNRGIMSSLIPIIEEICFNDFGAAKIEIRCARNNLGSNRVALKNAYSFERVHLNYREINGVSLDYNIYGKSREISE